MNSPESTLGGLWVRDFPGDPGGPVIVGLHGRGSLPERVEGFRPRIRGARHVLPRGIFSFDSGFAWYLGRPAPTEELAASVDALQKLFEALRAEGHPPDRTLIWGFSQGAMVALQIALTLPDPPAGVAAIAPKLHTSAAPLLSRASGQRFLLLHGESDETIKLEQGLEAKASLEAGGARCTWIPYPGAHEVTPRVIQELQTFASGVLAP